MKKGNKELLLRAKELIKQTRTIEELYSLTSILNMYISNPTKEYQTVLEVYCDMLEISIELDELEEKNKSKTKI